MKDAKPRMRLPPGPWRELLAHALRLLDDLRRFGVHDPFWTLGGGTVLMLRERHRRSKDVDIFVPDPQYLGCFSPRLNDLAESITSDYVEAAQYLKLILPQGEIDFVASTNLTAQPFEVWTILRRAVRVETPAEIVAKKLWHRGHQATARDLFDLCLVVERHGPALREAAPFLLRHRDAFVSQLQNRSAVLQAQFDAIDTWTYRPTFDEAVARVTQFLDSLNAP